MQQAFYDMLVKPTHTWDVHVCACMQREVCHQVVQALELLDAHTIFDSDAHEAVACLAGVLEHKVGERSLLQRHQFWNEHSA